MRRVIRSVAALLAIAFLSDVVDWAVWRVRVARGSGMGSVEVFRMTTVGLKGNKEALYPEGSSMVDCSRSAYPQVSGGACWWLRRHTQVIEKY